MPLTQENLKSSLRFDGETGHFFWLDTWGKVRQGDKAGTVSKANGYVYIHLRGRNYQGHQLAWLYVHGEIVRGLDHENRIRHDNRIVNLRRATQSQNCANMSLPKSNKSGIKGVLWDKRRGKWRAQIRANYRSIHVGYFDSIDDARIARENAACAQWGEFARTNL